MNRLERRTDGERGAETGGWAERWAAHPAGPVLLATMAFLEASVFPAPTEPLLVALGLGRPRRVWRLAALATAASLAGALAGYALGGLLFDEVGWPLLARFGGAEAFACVGALYRGGLFPALATSGFTPIPYFAYTLAAGAYGAPLPAFVAGALAGRALKYAAYAGAARLLGPALRRLLPDRRAWLVAVAAAALATLAWLVFR